MRKIDEDAILIIYDKNKELVECFEKAVAEYVKSIHVLEKLCIKKIRNIECETHNNECFLRVRNLIVELNNELSSINKLVYEGKLLDCQNNREKAELREAIIGFYIGRIFINCEREDNNEK